MQESAPYLGVHSDKPKAEDHLSEHCRWTVEHLPKEQARTAASEREREERERARPSEWVGHRCWLTHPLSLAFFPVRACGLQVAFKGHNGHYLSINSHGQCESHRVDA